MILELVQDYNAAIAAMPAGHTSRRTLATWSDFLVNWRHFFIENPTALVEQAFNVSQKGNISESATAHLKRPNCVVRPMILLRNRQEDLAAPMRVRTLAGHGDAVLCLAASANRRLLASGARNATVCVWDTGDGSLRLMLRGHTLPVHAVAFTADGRRLVSTSSVRHSRVRGMDRAVRKMLQTEGETRVWDAETGACETVIPESGCVLGPALSEREVLLADSHGVVKTVSVESGKCIHRFEWGSGRIVFFSLLDDGRLLLCAERGIIGLSQDRWDGRSTPQIVEFDCGQSIESACLFPEQRTVATGHDDGAVRLWDVERSQEIGQFQDLGGRVISLAVSPDGQQLAASGDLSDPTVVVRDLSSNTIVGRFDEHSNPICAVNFFRHDEIVSASADDTIKIWNCSDLTPLSESPRNSDSSIGPSSLFFLRSGAAVVASYRNAVNNLKRPDFAPFRVFDAICMRVIQSVHPQNYSDHLPSGISACARDPIGPWVYTVETAGLSGEALRRWSLVREVDEGELPLASAAGLQGNPILPQSFEVVRRLKFEPTKDEIMRMSLAGRNPFERRHEISVLPGGERIAVGDTQGRVQIFEGSAEESVVSFHLHGNYVSALDVSPDGSWLASGDADGQLACIDLRRGQLLFHDDLGRQRVTCLAFSPDGAWLLAGAATGELRMYQVAEKGLQKVMLLRDSIILAAAWQSDSRGFVTVSEDKLLRWWDRKNGGCLAAAAGRHPLTCCAVSPVDDRFVAAIDVRGNVFGFELCQDGVSEFFDKGLPATSASASSGQSVTDDLDELLGLVDPPTDIEPSRHTWATPPSNKEKES